MILIIPRARKAVFKHVLGVGVRSVGEQSGLVGGARGVTHRTDNMKSVVNDGAFGRT